jgi:hypothetical protein
MAQEPTVKVCEPGVEPRDAPVESATSAVGWCDLDADVGVDGALRAAASHCEGLTRGMLEELTTPDELPLSGGHVYDDGKVRLVSIAGILARRQIRNDSVAIGSLSVQPVELLASKQWLLSCWHPLRHYPPTGAEEITDRPDEELRERVAGAVARTWAARSRGEADCVSGGDLGLLLMHELALTFAPAQRSLYGWLEDWELRLYEGDMSLEQIAQQRKILRQLWRLRAVMRDWISPLNRPGMSRDERKIWLPASGRTEAEAIDNRIDRVLQNLASFGETLRASFHLLHAEEQEGERDRREDFQRRVELIAAGFLIPTFIVGFYGANTWLPGEGKQWGFAAMIAVVLILTFIGVSVLHRAQRNREAGRRRTTQAPEASN